jgi:phosphate transport system protein
MSKKFDTEISNLKNQLSRMGQNTKKMLLDSIVAMKNQDNRLAYYVIQEKAKLLNMEDSIEEKTLSLIAMYQPTAKDMRILATSLKLITYFQRIGQYSVELAESTIELSNQPHLRKLVSIPYMSQIIGSMIDDALNGFENDTIDGFDTLSDRFNDVEELRQSIFRECITYMMEDSKNISQCSTYMMTTRFLERCADYACKLGEAVIYMQSGDRIEINCNEETSKACFVKREVAA